jgi:hypothetical protein
MPARRGERFVRPARSPTHPSPNLPLPTPPSPPAPASSPSAPSSTPACSSPTLARWEGARCPSCRVDSRRACPAPPPCNHLTRPHARAHSPPPPLGILPNSPPRGLLRPLLALRPQARVLADARRRHARERRRVPGPHLGPIFHHAPGGGLGGGQRGRGAASDFRAGPLAAPGLHPSPCPAAPPTPQTPSPLTPGAPPPPPRPGHEPGHAAAPQGHPHRRHGGGPDLHRPGGGGLGWGAGGLGAETEAGRAKRAQAEGRAGVC